MSRVLVAGVDTSTQSTKVRVTDAETGEMVRFGQAKHPDGTSVNPDAWWQAFQEAAEQAGGLDDVADPAIAGKDVEGGCPIGPGGGDNAMASLGLSMGVGDVSISLGTSGVAAAISPVPAYDMTASVTGFADCTGHWLPLACTINGSRISDAGRAALGVDYDELAELAAAAEPGAGGITLVPHFDGERTPNRPDATAALYGMTLANTRRENIARAFVEGLLCSQRDCLELVKGSGRGRQAHPADRRRNQVRGRARAGPRDPRHGRRTARNRRVRGDRRGPSGRLGAVRRDRTADVAGQSRDHTDRRTNPAGVRAVRALARLMKSHDEVVGTTRASSLIAYHHQERNIDDFSFHSP